MTPEESLVLKRAMVWSLNFPGMVIGVNASFTSRTLMGMNRVLPSYRLR